MSALLDSLIQLLSALWDVVINLGAVMLPWAALIFFVAFWLLAVNWNRLWDVMIGSGAIVGVILLGLLAVLIWGVVSPPPGGVHSILGLRLGNFLGKLFYVSALISLAFLCGAVQLAGAVDRYLVFRKDVPAE